MKGRTTSVYSFWILAKSVSTASGMLVPFNSTSLSSLDLRTSIANYSKNKKGKSVIEIRVLPEHGMVQCLEVRP